MAANHRGAVMISTRSTKFFDIEPLIILAPMTRAVSTDLSASVAAVERLAAGAALRRIHPTTRSTEE
jgi:hypothetical protein